MTLFHSLAHHRSIKSQVIIYMICGFFLMTLIIGIITAASVNSLIRKVMLDNAVQISEGLAARAVFPILSGSEENAEEAMTQVKGFQSVVAARLIVKGQPLTFSKMVKDDEILKKDVDDLFSTQNEKITFTTKVIKSTDDYWLISAPVKLLHNDLAEADEYELSEFDETPEDNKRQEVIGTAEIIYSKKTLKSTQKRIISIIVGVGVVFVLILSVLLNIGFKRLFKPLQRLVKNMESTQVSGSYIQAEITGAKEIRVIASAYNKMLAALDQQEKALKQHRDKLEDEVKVRTKEFAEARDEAILASQHKTEFMANMSHELRTPIQAIIGYAELITEEIELDGDPALLDDLDKIMSNSTRLLGMINSLLDLAKIESGRMDVSISQFLLNELTSTIQDTIEPLIAKNSNVFTLESDNNIEFISSDKQKIEHILINLLSNACKFTNEGKVTLKIHQNVSSIIFDVIDTGIGLSAEQQEYVFEEFRQVDSGDARLFGGTGLGLSICKNFAELLGGTISVSSELNKGSTFSLEIKLS